MHSSAGTESTYTREVHDQQENIGPLRVIDLHQRPTRGSELQGVLQSSSYRSGSTGLRWPGVASRGEGEADGIILTHAPVPSHLDEEFESYLLSREHTSLPSPTYLDQQVEITENMRTILVDWLVEMADESNFSMVTLHLAVSLVDRFLSVTAVPYQLLQLLGTTCLWIAAKYEEPVTITADYIPFATDNTFTRQQALESEMQILRQLDFRISEPTTETFLRFYLHRGTDNGTIIYLAWYLAELSLLDYAMLHFSPSERAAGCLLWACFLLKLEVDEQTFVNMTGQEYQDLLPVLERLCYIHATAYYTKEGPFVKERFQGERYGKVSKIQPLPDHVVEELVGGSLMED